MRMKSIRTLAFALILLAVLPSFSPSKTNDQFAWVSKEIADAGQELLQNHDEVFLFCGCCKSDRGYFVTLSDAYVAHPSMGGEEQMDYWQVFVKGTGEYGEPVEQGIDLAYAWVEVNGNATPMCTILGLEGCDPCVEIFKW